MKYLDALLASQVARPLLTEPTQVATGDETGPDRFADRTDKSPVEVPDRRFVGLVSSPPSPIEASYDPPASGTVANLDGPPSDDARPPCGPPYPWRAELPGWSIPLREAWGRRSNQLEEVEGLRWWKAEQLAFSGLSRLKTRGLIAPGANSDAILVQLVEIEREAE